MVFHIPDWVVVAVLVTAGVLLALHVTVLVLYARSKTPLRLRVLGSICLGLALGWAGVVGAVGPGARYLAVPALLFLALAVRGFWVAGHGRPAAWALGGAATLAVLLVMVLPPWQRQREDDRRERESEAARRREERLCALAEPRFECRELFGMVSLPVSGDDVDEATAARLRQDGVTFWGQTRCEGDRIVASYVVNDTVDTRPTDDVLHWRDRAVAFLDQVAGCVRDPRWVREMKEAVKQQGLGRVDLPAAKGWSSLDVSAKAKPGRGTVLEIDAEVGEP